MKKSLTIALIILAIIGLWYFGRNKTSEPTPTAVTTTSRPDASNGTFQFDDGPITLKKGSDTQAINGSGLTQETDLTDIVAYGDINEDKKDDAVVILMQTGGGSGDFFYLSAYVSGLVNYKGTNTIFIGDRIEPKSVSIKNEIITLTYLDRKPNEPFASDPTILTTKQFIYKNGELVKK